MQVMPRTYDTLQRRYGLGSDPYEPRNNILAGAAYIREMHDRYGAPGFLAAYNAGPNRVDTVLSGATVLPDGTVNYLASVAPRLGIALPMDGPFAAYTGGGAMLGHRRVHAPEADRAYAEGGMVGTDHLASTAPAVGDPSLRAFDGGSPFEAVLGSPVRPGRPEAPDPSPPTKRPRRHASSRAAFQRS